MPNTPRLNSWTQHISMGHDPNLIVLITLLLKPYKEHTNNPPTKEEELKRKYYLNRIRSIRISQLHVIF